MRLPLNSQLVGSLFSTLGARRMPTLVGNQLRLGHGHAVNPGPPITYDYMPIPSQSYKRVHAELQRKFNRYLAISFTLFFTSAYLAYYYDTFELKTIACNPLSYRNRNKPKQAPVEQNE